jgi:hypothetical protein
MVGNRPVDTITERAATLSQAIVVAARAMTQTVNDHGAHISDQMSDEFHSQLDIWRSSAERVMEMVNAMEDSQ